ncbi:MAG: DUF4870 family protein [Steroidobacterales bacterium]
MNREPIVAEGGAGHPLIDYAQWIYGLHALAVVLGLVGTGAIALRFACGLPSIVAVIMNYARREQVRGSWLESHFRWQIRTFWFAWLWILVTLIVSMPLVLVLVGIALAYLGLAAVGIWVIYRIIRGWLALREGQPMPLPPLASP